MRHRRKVGHSTMNRNASLRGKITFQSDPKRIESRYKHRMERGFFKSETRLSQTSKMKQFKNNMAEQAPFPPNADTSATYARDNKTDLPFRPASRDRTHTKLYAQSILFTNKNIDIEFLIRFSVKIALGRENTIWLLRS